MIHKDFLIWFYKQKKQTVELSEIQNNYQNDLDFLSDFKNFIDVKDQHVSLKPGYSIGHLSIKRTIAFLLMLDSKDIAIDLFDLNGAMENDLVLVNHVTKTPYVVEILKSDLERLLADVRKSNGRVARFDSNQAKDKLIIVDNAPEYLVDGHVVLLQVKEITKTKVITEFKEVIGHKNDPDMEIVKIIYEYEWPLSFSKELLNELHHIKFDEQVEIKRRLNLRDEFVITIDGKDAKDLDDAISLKQIDENTFELGVHIADVSYYVKEGSLLDQEAYRRSTSVYLADRVIPMLPHALSNDSCSLNPFEPKYTLSCIMTINRDAVVTDYKIVESIIESKHRLTYDEVNILLKENVSLGSKQLDDMLFQMNELSKKLKMIRYKRGAIDFQSSELKFKLDLNGKVIDVEERMTDEAEQLIESFMILANEVVAIHFHESGLPGIYRVHEKPDVEKLDQAFISTKKLGFSAHNELKSTAKKLQKLTKDVSNTPFEYIVNMILLRSMQKAKYDEKPIGHFGLASPYYSHFTSPIRRYPDLLLHRMIREFMLKPLSEQELNDKKKYFAGKLPDYSEQTSKNERTAITMEREVNKLKSREYMENFIGQSFKGQITQILPSGFFVKVDKGIEGFVNVRNVNEYLIYDEENLLFFTDNGNRYRLGDFITVKLISVDKNENNIDFSIERKKRQGDDFKAKVNQSKKRQSSLSQKRGKTKGKPKRKVNHK
ncbi:Ribonuclease R [Acholeplasma oculi]|uniref:Ribonuclease R n=1 Tax=Acholeplasma oculi TaxID=35623 RepID=A0A061AB35_9MOLU|nr:ribonuclease R [Acholeplasma oculi]CDR31110.1 Ribonuclease R [Acholeplasma oculi]SKC37109.1 ribonuclease R [Acholeplasma oculi]SUT90818.1 Ribonuclease R [Acholeplasma oculi]